jgi:hypothetical protein
MPVYHESVSAPPNLKPSLGRKFIILCIPALLRLGSLEIFSCDVAQVAAPVPDQFKSRWPAEFSHRTLQALHYLRPPAFPRPNPRSFRIS